MSAIITPPDVFSLIMLGLPLIIFYELSIFIGKFIHFNNFDEADAYYVVCSNTIRMFEGAVNCTILYLSFGFNHHQYYKFCGIFHERLFECCVNVVKTLYARLGFFYKP